MRGKILISSVLLPLAMTTTVAGTLSVGDGKIDGRKLKPYEYTWRQCTVTDGKWQASDDLTEQLIAVDDSLLRHRQTVTQPDGAVVRSDTYFDRRSLAPVRMEMLVTRGDAQLAHAARHFDTNGYSGVVTRGEESKEVQGAISSSMLHGGALGLPLATLDYQAEPLEFAASMIGFDATYAVIAEWAGRENLQFEGRTIEAWLIDIEWRHQELGDIYPPGPDASGGRFWVVPAPPAGFPYVPRYKTDTYAVEFLPKFCD